jgi:predicted secreted protein
MRRNAMRMMVVLLAAGLSACAPTAQREPAQREPAPARPGPSQSLPAPVPQDVVVRISAEQNGQTVQVRVGERFAVALVGVPTAGYAWSPVEVPAFLTASGETSGPTIGAQLQPGFAGGRHWEVLMFTATTPGSGALRLEQRRPWETNEPPAETFAVTIEAE